MLEAHRSSRSALPVSGMPPLLGKAETERILVYSAMDLVADYLGITAGHRAQCGGPRMHRRGQAKPAPSQNRTWREPDVTMIVSGIVMLLKRSGCCDLGAQELRGGGEQEAPGCTQQRVGVNGRMQKTLQRRDVAGRGHPAPAPDVSSPSVLIGRHVTVLSVGLKLAALKVTSQCSPHSCEALATCGNRCPSQAGTEIRPC